MSIAKLVEKDVAPRNVYSATAPWFVPLIVGKGFSSGTYLHDAAERFNCESKPIKVLYLSDYDPEGEYFPDLFRTQLPQRYKCKANVEVKKLALSRKQIEDWNLPWISMRKPDPKHLRKQYVYNYSRLNNCDTEGWRKVELDAVSNLRLARLLQNRLKRVLKSKVVDETKRRSIEAVENWKQQHGL